MSGGTHSQGTFGKLLIEPGAAAHTFDANSYALEFLAEDIKHQGRHGGNNGIRGTLQADISRRRKLAGVYSGPIHCYVTPNNLDWLLLNVMGYTESPADTFTTDDTVPYFGLLIDRDEGVFEYKNCMLDSWILRARAPEFNEQGEPDIFMLTLNVIASDEATDTSWPGSPPSIGTTAIEDSPFVFADTDSGITISGSTRAVQAMVLAVRNNLYPKYANSLNPHSLVPRTRIVQLGFVVPWNSTNADLYNLSVDDASAVIAATNGTCSATFTIGKYSVPPQSPTIVEGKGEIKLRLDGQGLGDGNTADLVIVVDHTA